MFDGLVARGLNADCSRDADCPVGNCQHLIESGHILRNTSLVWSLVRVLAATLDAPAGGWPCFVSERRCGVETIAPVPTAVSDPGGYGCQWNGDVLSMKNISATPQLSQVKQDNLSADEVAWRDEGM